MIQHFTSGYLSETNKSIMSKRYLHPYVHRIFTHKVSVETTQVFMNR